MKKTFLSFLLLISLFPLSVYAEEKPVLLWNTRNYNGYVSGIADVGDGFLIKTKWGSFNKYSYEGNIISYSYNNVTNYENFVDNGTGLVTLYDNTLYMYDYNGENERKVVLEIDSASSSNFYKLLYDHDGYIIVSMENQNVIIKKYSKLGKMKWKKEYYNCDVDTYNNSKDGIVLFLYDKTKNEYKMVIVNGKGVEQTTSLLNQKYVYIDTAYTDNFVYSIGETEDDNYYVISKHNLSGKEIWRKELRKGSNERVRKITVTDDGFLVTKNNNSYISIIKFNKIGEKKWESKYSITPVDEDDIEDTVERENPCDILYLKDMFILVIDGTLSGNITSSGNSYNYTDLLAYSYSVSADNPEDSDDELDDPSGLGGNGDDGENKSDVDIQNPNTGLYDYAKILFIFNGIAIILYTILKKKDCFNKL